MISKVGTGNPVYLQKTQGSKDKEGLAQVKKNKELDKVATIKEQIKNGSYKLDIQKTAESVMKELI